MQQTETQLQEDTAEFIIFMKEDGPKKLLLMTSMFFTIRTEDKKDLMRIHKEENFDQ